MMARGPLSLISFRQLSVLWMLIFLPLTASLNGASAASAEADVRRLRVAEQMMLDEWETIRTDVQATQSLEIEWMRQQSAPAGSADLIDSSLGSDAEHAEQTVDDREVPHIDLCRVGEAEQPEEACGTQLEGEAGVDPLQDVHFRDFLKTAAQQGKRLDDVYESLSKCGMVKCNAEAGRTQVEELSQNTAAQEMLLPSSLATSSSSSAVSVAPTTPPPAPLTISPTETSAPSSPTPTDKTTMAEAWEVQTTPKMLMIWNNTIPVMLNTTVWEEMMNKTFAQTCDPTGKCKPKLPVWPLDKRLAHLRKMLLILGVLTHDVYVKAKQLMIVGKYVWELRPVESKQVITQDGINAMKPALNMNENAYHGAESWVNALESPGMAKKLKKALKGSTGRRLLEVYRQGNAAKQDDDEIFLEFT